MKAEDVCIENVLAIPKPWGVTRSDGAVALNDNGTEAMNALLFLHADCIDEEAALKCTRNKSTKGMYLVLAEAAGKFIEQHHDSAPCVEGFFTPEALCTLMALYKIKMLHLAGVGEGGVS